jgi:DNA-binding SARP family transcriptional activator
MGDVSELRFRVLGPLAVVAGERAVEVPAGQMRTLMASLLLEEGVPVPVDALAERLWPDRMPAHARAVVHTYVGRLRRLLGHEVVQTTRGGGYLLVADTEHVDLWWFRELLDRSRTAESAETELALLEEALRLWRGRPFADIRSAWFDREAVPRFTEEWLEAVERRIDLRMRGGNLGEVIAELRRLVAEEPTRESLWARLIEALYRSGRRVEALEAYQQVRTLLTGEYGIDPGAALQQLHQMILRDDMNGAAVPGLPRVPASGVHQLPHDIAGFCDRAELAHLNQLASAARDGERGLTRIVAIDGGPGVGKTTLAVHWAHQMAAAYPDVHLYLNLRGYGPAEPLTPAEATGTLLRVLGVGNDAIPGDDEERSALLRGVLAGRRVLLLLDDARDADQVRPLLPGGDSLVIVTSRRQLRGLVIRDGAHQVTVGRLPAREGLAVLAAAVGAERVAAESEVAARLVELCDGLPLALAIVAERASRTNRLRDLVEALEGEKTRLDAFGAGEADPHTDLRVTLSWSYRALDPDAAVMFRRLGLHPSSTVGVEAAAELAGVPVREAARTLDRLVAAHLVQQPQPDRYEMHDLIRRYAAECAHQDEPGDERVAALHRMMNWYLGAAVNADAILVPHRIRDFVAPYIPAVTARFDSVQAAFAWFAREYDCLRIVVSWGAVNGWSRHAWRIAIAAATFFDAKIPWREGLEFYETALRAAERTGDRIGEAFVLNSLGYIHSDREDWTTAASCFRQSLDRFREAGHPRGEAMVLGNQALAAAHFGDHAAAQEHAARALELYRRLELPRGIAANLDNLGVALASAGEHRQAIDCYLRADALARHQGDMHNRARIQHRLGTAYAAIGDVREAVHAYRQAINGHRASGMRRWEAFTLIDLATTLRQAGHPTTGDAALQVALDILTELVDPRAREVEATLARTS